MRPLSIALKAALCWMLIVTPVSAQVGDAMNKHFAGMKGYSTSTSAGHYEGQTQNVYTLGSFSYRQEQRDYQMGAIQLPKLKAGCGGIDIFKGGFSFISGDQLKAMMRNILQNATTYAFKLAIDTVSPLIGKNMTELTKIVQDINSFNISSCETAMQAVDSLYTDLAEAAGVTCAQTGASKGTFTDSIRARMSCPNEAASVAKSGDEAEKAASPVNRNYAYDATKNNSLYGSDDDMREFLMSISGTQITSITDGAGGTSISVQYVPPITLDDGAIRVLMEGGSLRIHQCAPAPAGSEPCLVVNERAKTVNITSSQAYKQRVEDILTSIYDKVTGAVSSGLTDEEIGFVNETTIPIYKAIEVYAQAVPNSGRQQILTYADLLAYEMVLKFLMDQSKIVIEGANTITGGQGASLDAWRADVRENIKSLQTMKGQIDERLTATVAIISNIQDMEQTVAASLIQALDSNSDYMVSGSR